jgi:hypothetical protein
LELSGKIKLKVTWLISITDKSRAPDDPRYAKLLLDNESPISITLEEIRNVNLVLTRLNERFLKYDDKFVIKNLAGFRVLEENLCEAVYVSALNYVPGLNKDGTIYSLEELQQRNISIGEYYERAIIRHGSGAYR